MAEVQFAPNQVYYTTNGISSSCDRTAGYEVIHQVGFHSTNKRFVAGATAEEAEAIVRADFDKEVELKIIATVRVIK